MTQLMMERPSRSRSPVNRPSSVAQTVVTHPPPAWSLVPAHLERELFSTTNLSDLIDMLMELVQILEEQFLVDEKDFESESNPETAHLWEAAASGVSFVDSDSSDILE